MSDDTFYDIPSYKGRLKINKNGEVLSLISNKILKTNYLPSGYEIIVLMLKNPRRTKTLYVHRLLAETFIPNPFNKKYINHKNGNKQDNRVENLEWVTPSENNFHAYNTGLKTPSIDEILKINVQNRKLTINQAKIVKQNLNLSIKEVCELLDLPYKKYEKIIYDIRRGVTYKDV